MKQLLSASLLLAALVASVTWHFSRRPLPPAVEIPESPEKTSKLEPSKQEMPVTEQERAIRDGDARNLAIGFEDFLTDWQVSRMTTPNDPATDRAIAYARKLKPFDPIQLEIFSSQILEGIDTSQAGAYDRLALYINAVSMCQPKAAILLLKRPPVEFKDVNQWNQLAELWSAHAGALTNLATREPEAALQWVVANKDVFSTFVREATRSSMAINAGRTNPEFGIRIAYEWFGGVPSGPLMLITQAATSQQQRAAILDAARECSRKLYPGESDNHRMDDIVGSVAGGVVNEGYASAAQWIQDAGLSPLELDAFAGGVVWTKPEDCLRWIEWLTKNASRDRAESGIFQVVAKWSEYNPQATEKWLKSYREGNLKNWAISAFVWTIAEKSPQTAAMWVMKLPAGDLRNGAVRDVYRKWPKNDPQGAAKFAEKLKIRK